MRGFVLAAVMFGAASGAQAADMPDLPILRGALTDGLTTVNWQGYYIGGQWGYGSSDVDFRRVPSTAPLLQVLLLNVKWALLDRRPVSASCPAARQAGAPSPVTTRNGMTSSLDWRRVICMAGLVACLAGLGTAPPWCPRLIAPFHKW